MKSFLVISSIMATALLSPLSQAQGSLDAAIEQCRTEQNALKRLVCYDEISIKTTAQPEARTTAKAAPAVAPAPSTSNNSAFGLEHKQKNQDTADQIYVTVKSLSYNPRKELLIEFDNGQIWRQTSSRTYLVKEGEQHFIKRGMLGAFYLGNDRNNRTVKIIREE